jgi:hypothetical protein
MSSNELPSTPGAAPHGIKAVIPEGDSTLWVEEIASGQPGLTTEGNFRNLGREALGEVLTPNYGWGEVTRTTYIADWIGRHSRGMDRLSALMYQQRWTPEVPASDEKSFILYDLNEPAVAVRPLASALDPDSAA